ncbi:MAG: L-lysine 6-transaminase [Planctomycetota bacterium]
MTAANVHDSLKRHLLVDGMPMVLDTRESRGAYLVDETTGKKHIDFFTFYASNPLGMNHPRLADDGEFHGRLLDAAINKVANPDVYTVHKARFVDTFSRVGIPAHLPYTFFISGGALAVENALKVAFDWKARKNMLKGLDGERNLQAMHLRQAFHGRSGYTLSITNTEPMKVAYFPKFDWPRILNPKCNKPSTPENLAEVEKAEEESLAQAKQYFAERPDDIACVIAEPIQGEGGDNHFRPEYLQRLKDLAHENDALLVFDEVQTGVGLTGSFWAHQQLGVTPDVMAFGKKTQVCGVLAGGRLDEIDDHVFKVSSRISSTWGGHLADMVRFERILEVIEEENLVQHAADTGVYLLEQIRGLAENLPIVANPRGRGLFCAFDLPSREVRDRVTGKCYDRGLAILGCGPESIRFRPPLTITREVLDEGLAILTQALEEEA